MRKVISRCFVIFIIAMAAIIVSFDTLAERIRMSRVRVWEEQVLFSDLLNKNAVDLERMKKRMDNRIWNETIIGENFVIAGKIDYNKLPFYSFDIPYHVKQHYSKINPIIDSCDFFEVEGAYYIRINYLTNLKGEGYHSYYRLDTGYVIDAFDLGGETA